MATIAAAQSNVPQNVPGPVPVMVSPALERAAASVGQAPVEFFRKLLEASPTERSRMLAGRPESRKAQVLAKVREYEALNPEEREARLQATELRWYLMPLMRAARANRAPLLERVPPDLLPLVKSRLLQWDILPPPLQQEFLANDDALRYFAQTSRAGTTNAAEEKMAEQFSRIFQVTPDERKRLLDTLSDAERAQMEKTLKTFDDMPPQQKLMCVRNYAKFAGMSEADRAEFLKNADNWSKMSADERQTWRDLVAAVPIWPPMPPLMPPLPPSLAPNAPRSPVATNH
jgi:hypothetical protein